MSIVVDSSVLVAALIVDDSNGRWARDVLLNDDLAGPHILPAEVVNVLRKAEASAAIGSDTARNALHDLNRLSIEYLDYEPFAQRTWELRHHVGTYDAWYVAIAETLGAPLATLDGRLTTAPGPACAFLTPGDSV
jgi:predicted nucleic acid-binding protein